MIQGLTKTQLMTRTALTATTSAVKVSCSHLLQAAIADRVFPWGESDGKHGQKLRAELGKSEPESYNFVNAKFLKTKLQGLFSQHEILVKNLCLSDLNALRAQLKLRGLVRELADNPSKEQCIIHIIQQKAGIRDTRHPNSLMGRTEGAPAPSPRIYRRKR